MTVLSKSLFPLIIISVKPQRVHNNIVKCYIIVIGPFSPSHLSTSTLRTVPAWIMTCQCVPSSVISVVIWFLAISSFIRYRHLSLGLPRFRFPSTVICNIFLVASSSYRLRTCPNHINLFYLPSGTCVHIYRCPHFSHDLVLYFLLLPVISPFHL